MDIILKEELRKCCVVYLDDNLVYGQSLEQRMKDLEKVCNLLKKAGLKIKLSKCKFAALQVKYLGFLIDRNVIKPDPEKVAAIEKYPPP